MNTFELAVEDDGITVDQGFLISRRDQCMSPTSEDVVTSRQQFITDKLVFPSLEFIGWYTVAQRPSSLHIAINEQVCIFMCHAIPGTNCTRSF